MVSNSILSGSLGLLAAVEVVVSTVVVVLLVAFFFLRDFDSKVACRCDMRQATSRNFMCLSNDCCWTDFTLAKCRHNKQPARKDNRLGSLLQTYSIYIYKVIPLKESETAAWGATATSKCQHVDSEDSPCVGPSQGSRRIVIAILHSETKRT